MYSHTPFQKGGVGINQFPKFENEYVLLADVLFKRVMTKGETPDKMLVQWKRCHSKVHVESAPVDCLSSERKGTISGYVCVVLC